MENKHLPKEYIDKLKENYPIYFENPYPKHLFVQEIYAEFKTFDLNDLFEDMCKTYIDEVSYYSAYAESDTYENAVREAETNVKQWKEILNKLSRKE